MNTKYQGTPPPQPIVPNPHPSLIDDLEDSGGVLEVIRYSGLNLSFCKKNYQRNHIVIIIIKIQYAMNFKAINILNLPESIQIEVLKVRNQEDIRKSMYYDNIIEESEHLRWISNLKSNQKNLVLTIINDQGSSIGSVSAISIDKIHLKTDWGYYLSSEYRNSGLSACIEYKFIDFAFETLGLQKINCEVIETNDKVVSLHKKFGFKEEGFRRSNIIKNNERIGVYFLGLTKQEWIESKHELKSKYSKVFSKFKIDFPSLVETQEPDERMVHDFETDLSVMSRNKLLEEIEEMKKE